MEGNINFWKMEDNLIFYKSKMNFYDQMEDDLNILVNGRQPPKLKKKKTMQPKENKNIFLCSFPT